MTIPALWSRLRASPTAARVGLVLLSLALVATGSLLRLHAAGDKSDLQLDEGYSLGNALALSKTLRQRADDVLPPDGEWSTTTEFRKPLTERSSRVLF